MIMHNGRKSILEGIKEPLLHYILEHREMRLFVAVHMIVIKAAGLCEEL